MLSWRFGRPLAICSELSLYKECVCVCVCVREGLGGCGGSGVRQCLSLGLHSETQWKLSLPAFNIQTHRLQSLHVHNDSCTVQLKFCWEDYFIQTP